MTADPKSLHRPGFRIAGLRSTTSNKNESTAHAKIPILWDRFFIEDVEPKIPGRVNPEKLMAVYSDYEPLDRDPDKREYRITVGGEAEAIDKLPAGLVGLTVKAGTYLVFTKTGPMPDVVYAAWKDVWKYFERGKKYKRAFVADLEIYDKGKMDPETTVELWISVKRVKHA